MPRIVPGIETLDQHRSTLFSDPERYRPDACTECGLAHPWAHGCYTRKSDRPPGGDGPRNPILIPRFICRNPACRRTCSRLPSCIPPRRWYLWSVRQVVLILVLTGVSPRAAATHFAPHAGPVRSTIRRWRDWLRPAPTSKEPAACFIFRLKGRFPELALDGDGDAFWLGCLRRLGLAKAMTALDALWGRSSHERLTPGGGETAPNGRFGDSTQFGHCPKRASAVTLGDRSSKTLNK